MKKLSNAMMLTFLLTAVSFTVQAQVNIGARAGYRWANVNSTESLDNITQSFRGIESPEFTVFAEIPVTKNFSFQPEFTYATKGFAFDQDANVALFGIDLPLGARAESRFRYIEAPLLAKYAFGDGPLRAYVAAGPTLGYATKGVVETRANVLIDLKVGETPINLDGNNFERFEVGATAGAGVEFQLPFAKLFADARYQHGFTEVYDIPVVEEKVRHQGFNLNLGIALPISN